ncbi:MAG: helix-turn-helix domain-containing protein [Clostridiales bacterium]|nr:helix-turn-helix domain-containing protein [Clostridiales bacterium]
MIETLGSKLKKLRESRRLNQEQVAAIIDVTRSAICTYENDNRQPSYDILVRLAQLYRVTTDYLLGCQSRKMIDVSNLSARDVAIVQVLIVEMERRTEENSDGDEYGDAGSNDK